MKKDPKLVLNDISTPKKVISFLSRLPDNTEMAAGFVDGQFYVVMFKMNAKIARALNKSAK